MSQSSGLRRSRDGMIAGVCAGIAESMDVSPGLVRLLYVLVSMCSAAFPGVLVYIVLWILMPPPEEN
ncbi:MAG: PspC domain-containing protein [Candidatus Hydrogenedentes bacterium]|nr:PspC domain-containing protein [Candidatus Hydrogenedentota bacterium]